MNCETGEKNWVTVLNMLSKPLVKPQLHMHVHGNFQNSELLCYMCSYRKSLNEGKCQFVNPCFMFSFFINSIC